MHNEKFQNANKVFVGVLRTNKSNGLDVRKPKVAISKADVEKVYDDYFLPGLANEDTEVLQHKVFFDLVYFMGRRAKEGLRQLQKNWFVINTDAEGHEYVQIVVNETTKKNQGDNLSTARTLVHDDQNLMFALPGNDRCPVKSFKLYVDLLNEKINDFFQRPSYNKKKYDAMAVGVQTLGKMMAVISVNANLSRRYTNHEIRKTTGTAMKRGGVNDTSIAHHLKHRDLQSLQHYLEKPTIEEKKQNAIALFNYTVSNPEERIDTPSEKPVPQPKEADLPPAPIPDPPEAVEIVINQENVLPENAVIPFEANLDHAPPEIAQMIPVPIAAPVPANAQVTNQMNNLQKQAPVMFGGATFNNCTINFQMPQ